MELIFLKVNGRKIQKSNSCTLDKSFSGYERLHMYNSVHLKVTLSYILDYMYLLIQKIDPTIVRIALQHMEFDFASSANYFWTFVSIII